MLWNWFKRRFTPRTKQRQEVKSVTSPNVELINKMLLDEEKVDELVKQRLVSVFTYDKEKTAHINRLLKNVPLSKRL